MKKDLRPTKKTEEKNDNNQELLVVLEKINQSNQELLILNQKIASSNEYLKRYFHFRFIASIIKWVVLIIILVFGFISFNIVFDYLRNNIDLYQDRVNQVVGYK